MSEEKREIKSELSRIPPDNFELAVMLFIISGLVGGVGGLYMLLRGITQS